MSTPELHILQRIPILHFVCTSHIKTLSPTAGAVWSQRHSSELLGLLTQRAGNFEENSPHLFLCFISCTGIVLAADLQDFTKILY